MSLDPSLKGANALIRHRNVLTRAERLEKLKEEEKWTDAKSVFGLPKVAHRKATVTRRSRKSRRRRNCRDAGRCCTGRQRNCRRWGHAAGRTREALPPCRQSARQPLRAGPAAAAAKPLLRPPSNTG
jgi:small basic protein (TIGR04137 family)